MGSSPAPATTMPRAGEGSREMPKVPDSDQESRAGNTATVVIRAPAGVRVTVDGQDTGRQAPEATFNTPALQPGQTYSYQFKAEVVRDGQPVSEVKKVLVRAGERSVVDFNHLAPPAREVSRVAVVTFEAPEDARVWVAGVRWPLSRTQRSFNTPELEPGKTYFYEVKAEVVRDGKVQSEQQRIAVTPGKHITVEFKNLSPVQTVSR
jgi:uncharacterized protein (TIGR03000 family)